MVEALRAAVLVDRRAAALAAEEPSIMVDTSVGGGGSLCVCVCVCVFGG